MKASHFMGLVFTWAMASSVAHAEDNPFIPAEPGGSLSQMERRLNDLERRVQESEMRSEEDMISSQFPGVRIDDSGSTDTRSGLKDTDTVLGRLNGHCLIKRVDPAGRDRVMTVPSVSDCSTPERQAAESPENPTSNRQRP